MNIGFDAKRAFLNRSGLGNYSRDTIRILYEQQPDNHYFLFTPDTRKNLFTLPGSDKLEIIKPERGVYRWFPSYWRSIHLSPSIRKHRIDIYHGLSNELPWDILRSGARSVVTIHDLIFIRFPMLYRRSDRSIYRVKFRRSVKNADLVIAISQQTKNDLLEFFSADEKKIRVIYQGCSPVFYQTHSEEEKTALAEKYSIPRHFLLAVGTVEERKNALGLARAIHAANIDYPLLFIGRHTHYARKVKEYIARNGLEQVYFIENIPFPELPIVYQMADLLIYPSLFEGFGIPVLEALVSGVPVITSRDGCFMEAGGPGTCYVDPLDENELGTQIRRLLSDELARKRMAEEGRIYAHQFSDRNIAKNIAEAYQSIL
jgi:glycosyltransferase involved in cell wall biosynthesis